MGSNHGKSLATGGRREGRRDSLPDNVSGASSFPKTSDNQRGKTKVKYLEQSKNGRLYTTSGKGQPDNPRRQSKHNNRQSTDSSTGSSLVTEDTTNIPTPLLLNQRRGSSISAKNVPRPTSESLINLQASLKDRDSLEPYHDADLDPAMSAYAQENTRGMMHPMRRSQSAHNICCCSHHHHHPHQIDGDGDRGQLIYREMDARHNRSFGMHTEDLRIRTGPDRYIIVTPRGPKQSGENDAGFLESWVENQTTTTNQSLKKGVYERNPHKTARNDHLHSIKKQSRRKVYATGKGEEVSTNRDSAMTSSDTDQSSHREYSFRTCPGPVEHSAGSEDEDGPPAAFYSGIGAKYGEYDPSTQPGRYTQDSMKSDRGPNHTADRRYNKAHSMENLSDPSHRHDVEMEEHYGAASSKSRYRGQGVGKSSNGSASLYDHYAPNLEDSRQQRGRPHDSGSMRSNPSSYGSRDRLSDKEPAEVRSYWDHSGTMYMRFYKCDVKIIDQRPSHAPSTLSSHTGSQYSHGYHTADTSQSQYSHGTR